MDSQTIALIGGLELDPDLGPALLRPNPLTVTPLAAQLHS
jgi:hypothetical protein